MRHFGEAAFFYPSLPRFPPRRSDDIFIPSKTLQLFPLPCRTVALKLHPVLCETQPCTGGFFGKLCGCLVAVKSGGVEETRQTEGSGCLQNLVTLRVRTPPLHLI